MKDSEQSGGSGGKGSGGLEAAPGWVRRLYAGAGLHLSEKRLAWNGVHIEQFLAWCGRLGEGADREGLGGLAVLFLFGVLGVDTDGRIDVVRAKTSRRLPVVLSEAEVGRLMGLLEGTNSGFFRRSP